MEDAACGNSRSKWGEATLYRVCVEKGSRELMDKGICKYAIPMKPPYEFPFACAVMYECRWKEGGRNMYKSCPRFQIGQNRERDGLELRGMRVIKRYAEIRKALEDPTVKK